MYQTKPPTTHTHTHTCHSVIAIMLRLADAVEAPAQTPPKPQQLYAAQGLLGYTAVLFVVRVAATGA